MTRRRTWVLGVLIAAAALPAFAGEDEKPVAEPLTVRAKLSRPLTKDDAAPFLAALSSGSPFPLASALVTTEGTSLRGSFQGESREGPGLVRLSFGSGDRALHVLEACPRMQGEIDLGEIRLEDPAPVLVAGRATDPDGAPASGAALTVSVTGPGFGASCVADTTCAADGTFRVIGLVRGEGARIRVEGTGAWRPGTRADVPPATLDAQVVVTPPEGVSGTLDLPAGLAPEDLEVVVSGLTEVGTVVKVTGSDQWSLGSRELRFRCTGRSFVVLGLATGTYDVGVRMPGSSRFLARQTGVTVASGSTLLAPLSVAGPVRTVKTTVRTADGGPTPGARVWAREHGDDGAYRELAVGDDATATVAFLGEEVSLAAVGDGTAFVFATSKGPEAVLVPPPATPVQVTLEPSYGDRRPSATQRKRAATILLRWRAPPEASEPEPCVDGDGKDPRTHVEISLPVPETGPAVASVIVPGWYQLCLRTGDANRYTTSTCGVVRVDGKGPVTAPLDLHVELPRDFDLPDDRPRGLGLRGTVELPEGLELADLVLVISGPPGGVQGASVLGSGHSTFDRERLEFGACTPFVVSDLAPGEYEVRLKFSGSSRWLARAAGVKVEDAMFEMSPLTVTTPIRRIQVTVVPPDGADPATAKLWVRNGGDLGNHRDVKLGADGVSDVVYAGEGVSLMARADGSDFGFATTSAASATIELPPALRCPVTIALPAGLSKRARKSKAYVKLEWCGPPGSSMPGPERNTEVTDPRSELKLETPLPAEGPVKATIDVAGWYRITFGAHKGRGWTETPRGAVLVRTKDATAAELDMSAAEIEQFLDDL